MHRSKGHHYSITSSAGTVPAIRGTGVIECRRQASDQSGFAPENLMTFAHFSVSSAIRPNRRQRTNMPEVPAGLAPSCVAERPSAGKRRVAQSPHDQRRYATVGEYLIRLAAEQESRDAAPAV
jgi:hypothetical protein